MIRTLFATLVIFGTTSSAETITVCLDGSCDYSDIREAVDAAQDFDVIEIAPGTYQPAGTIALEGRISLRGSIDKNGEPTTTIDGQGEFGVFHCQNGNGAVFENLVITGGESEFGGGIRLLSSNGITITNCIFRENSANTRGGGLDCVDSRVNVDDSRIIGNSAGSSGGGVACRGVVSNGFQSTFNHCVFSGNSASYGGGIDCDASNPILAGCLFEENTASFQGGGLNGVNQSAPVLDACVFRANTSFDVGGGVSGSVNASPVLRDTILCGNVPNQIDGPFTDEGDNCMAFSCSDRDDDGIPDKCDGTNPGVLLVPSEYPTIASAIMVAGDSDIIKIASGTHVAAQALDPEGKAITVRGAVDAAGNPATIIAGSGFDRVLQCTSGEQADTIFENLVITGGRATNGGGMFCEFSSPALINCVFQDNISTYGGGLSCQESSPTLSDCVFRRNSAAAGGGMRCYWSSPTLDNCRFEENDAEFNGGGLLCNFLSTPDLQACLFVTNSAGDDGGGLYSNPTSNPGLSDTMICGNTPDQVFGTFEDHGGNCVRESCDECDPSNCPTDLDGDTFTNGVDLGLLFIAWGPCESCAEDFNDDGEVDGQDLGILFSGWGSCR
jgi:hypothetical protein